MVATDSSASSSQTVDGQGAWRAIVLLLALGALLLVGCSKHGGGGDPGEPRAVIVDQLAFTDPNPQFINSATELLTEAGYRVDYVPPERVSVDFYRSLPKDQYAFIIIRSHSYGTTFEANGSVAHASVGLFTTEPYAISTHTREQALGELDIARYPQKLNGYFGIPDVFVNAEMKGSFPQSTMILMGCDGLSSDGLARAFINRGIQALVGWDGDVTAAHTDNAVNSLLTLLLRDRQPLASAVEDTAQRFGPDAVYGGKLMLFAPNG